MKKTMIVGFALSLLCSACGSSADDAITSSKIGVSPDPEVGGHEPDAGTNADTGFQWQNVTSLVFEQRKLSEPPTNFQAPLCNATYDTQKVDIASRKIFDSHCQTGWAQEFATVTFSEADLQTLLTALRTLEVVGDGACAPAIYLESLAVQSGSEITTHHDSAGVCNRSTTGFTYAKNVSVISTVVRMLVKENWSTRQ